MKKIKKAFIALYYICLILVLRLYVGISKLFSNKYKDIWLIAERGIDARDNAYAFYKYLALNHPLTKMYYVITDDSPDVERIEEEHRCRYKSFKHMILLAAAKYNVSTHDMGTSPDMVIFHWIEKFIKLIPGKLIFLQHGIIKEDIKWYHKKEFRTDLFVTSTSKEYDFVLENFGFDENTIKLLGMCRYDNLQPAPQNQKMILVMPTWRMYLQNTSTENFEKSTYYRQYQKLLNDSDLIKLLHDNNYQLVFYPHIEMQKYLSSFSTYSGLIKICSAENEDVADLLKRCSLLITDYSSVLFDVAYMEKPIICYQPDSAKYHEQHYQEGYFTFQEFGPKVASHLSLIQEIEKFFEQQKEGSSECKLERSQYKAQEYDFFKYHDQNNCKRVYDEIINLN